MPRHTNIRWQYRPDKDQIGFAHILMMLTPRERDAVERAERVIIEEIEAAGLDTERVHGEVVISGRHPTVRFDRHGMDAVGTGDPRLAEPSDEPTA